MGTDGDEDEGSKTPMVDACWKVMVVEEEDVNRDRDTPVVWCVEGEKKEKKGRKKKKEKVLGTYRYVFLPQKDGRRGTAPGEVAATAGAATW